MNKTTMMKQGTRQLLLCSFLLSIASQGKAQEPGVGATNNLLPNPSFEIRNADKVEGWTPRAWQGEGNAAWRNETPGRNGGRCVSIQSSLGADAAWTATVRVKSNTWYRLSGWIKTEAVSGAMGALLNVQNTTDVKTSPLTGTRDWTRVETVFQTGRTGIEINCLFGGWGASTGKAWYDDVKLETIDGPGALEALIAIDTDSPARPYSPMIFGGFLEHFDHQIYGGIFDPGSPLSDTNGFRRDVMEALKELHTPVVRWPGGCFVSGYHWELGVGQNRIPTDDMAWGVIEPNTFGTDEYVKLCRLLGWEPYICSNAGNGTIEEMRNWVEYCNSMKGKYADLRKADGHSEPLNVPIWSIGNENYYPGEIGHKPIEQWAPFVASAARQMKAADSNIVLTAAALPTREWALPLLKAAGSYLSYISIHGYWLPLWVRNDMPDYLTCIMKSEAPEQSLENFIRILDESGYRGKIKIAYDEWNLRGWHHPGFPRKTVQDYSDPEVQRLIKARELNDIPSQYTMADALFSASFFNACLRHADDVGMANIAPLINTRGPLFVYSNGIVKRTHFYAMAMYANDLEPLVARATVTAGRLVHGDDSVPVADAIATVDDSGQNWALALVNRDPAKAVACTIRFKNQLVEGKFSAIVLEGDSPEAFNSIENPNRVVPEKKEFSLEKGVVELPPHSLTILKVKSPH